ncbi:hypothetical protein TSAR_014558 [Trichomalopsis sarcophagae]|uniref:Uncharacterized protein n=1 Tax=Trichomalopsis sarcophagae TaxID=543379 RepID=A0A232EED8_9HYME|nr:hypothetical protein TSAR_014558 [Trichomalopsis sarcophagae]
MATTAERGTGWTEARRYYTVRLLEVSLSQRSTPKSEHSFSRNVGRSLKKRSRSFRERRNVGGSPEQHVQLVNRSGALLFLFNKNPSPVSSEMSIDRLSSAFVAFAKKCALKIDFSEIERCYFFVYKNPNPVSNKM